MRVYLDLSFVWFLPSFFVVQNAIQGIYSCFLFRRFCCVVFENQSRVWFSLKFAIEGNCNQKGIQNFMSKNSISGLFSCVGSVSAVNLKSKEGLRTNMQDPLPLKAQHKLLYIHTYTLYTFYGIQNCRRNKNAGLF